MMTDTQCNSLKELESSLIDKYITAAKISMPIAEHMQYVKTICELNSLIRGREKHRHEKEERDIYKMIECCKAKKSLLKTTHTGKDEAVNAFVKVLEEWERIVLDLYHTAEYDYEKKMIEHAVRRIWNSN